MCTWFYINFERQVSMDFDEDYEQPVDDLEDDCFDLSAELEASMRLYNNQ